MKFKKIVLFFFACFCLFSIETKAQDYARSVGIRGLIGANATYKHFISNYSAFEGMVGFTFSNLYLAAVYEKHNAFKNEVPGLNWYWGAGASLLFKSGSMGIGLVGAIGLDYSFRDLPLNLSIDWMPNIFLTGYDALQFTSGGISIRYILER